MTRYEFIKNMSVEEMIGIIDREPGSCERCIWKNEYCYNKVCAEGIKKWLLEDITASWVPCEGKRKEGSSAYKCSHCGQVQQLMRTPQENGYNYCPHCGAKMDGDKIIL